MLSVPDDKSQYASFQPELIPTEPFLYLDPGGIGFFTILAKFEKMVSRSYPMRLLPDVLRYTDKERDTWISQNQFFRRNRRLVNLWQINTAFADLDTYNRPDLAKIPPEGQAMLLLEECFERKIPPPSVVLFSGRGLQPKWIFSRPVPRQALARWNAVQRHITASLKGLMADRMSIDGSRVLRLDRTMNTKSGERVRVLWPEGRVPVEWDFESLADEILPFTREDLEKMREAREKKPAQAVSQAARRNLLFTRQSLHWARLEDIRKLAYLRGWTQGNPDGWRDPFIYYGAISCSWVAKGNLLFWETEALAKEFAPHWSKAKLMGAVSSYFRAVEKGRRFQVKNQRLIDVLEITGEEERQLRVIISKDEARRRHREREMARRRASGALERGEYEARARERKEKALEMRKKGLKVREIARELSISIPRVYQLLS